MTQRSEVHQWASARQAPFNMSKFLHGEVLIALVRLWVINSSRIMLWCALQGVNLRYLGWLRDCLLNLGGKQSEGAAQAVLAEMVVRVVKLRHRKLMRLVDSDLGLGRDLPYIWLSRQLVRTVLSEGRVRCAAWPPIRSCGPYLSSGCLVQLADNFWDRILPYDLVHKFRVSSILHPCACSIRSGADCSCGCRFSCRRRRRSV